MKRHDSVSKLVDLAGSRIDIFYHASTNTHIVCQKNEAVFYNFPIKGTADFADDAHQAFLRNVEAVAHELDDLELAQAIELCNAIPPACTRKFELQVAIREEISSRIRDRAKSENKSLSRFLEELVNKTLPEFHSKSELIKWASQVKESAVGSASSTTGIYSSPVSFALPLSHGSFERVNQVVTESGVFDGVNEMLEDIIAFSFSQDRTNAQIRH